MDTETVEALSFTAFDRCDRCGAQALAKAVKDDLEPLLFCQNHKNRYEDALRAQGFVVMFDNATFESYRQPVAV